MIDLELYHECRLHQVPVLSCLSPMSLSGVLPERLLAAATVEC